jgi:hypothetical protein
MKKSLIATKNPLIYSGNSGVKRTTITIMKTDKMKTTIIQELTDNYWFPTVFQKIVVESSGIAVGGKESCAKCLSLVRKPIVQKLSKQKRDLINITMMIILHK